MPSPNPAGGGFLQSVAATSAGNAWAVGQAGSGRTLILHWDGAAWKRVPSPNVAPGILTSVTATSARSAWAVGWTHGALAARTLILRWNGTSWK